MKLLVGIITMSFICACADEVPKTTNTYDTGIVIERGDQANAFIGFDESEDKFTVGTGSFTGSSTGSLTITTGTLVANIEGNLTGTVQTAAQTNITSVGALDGGSITSGFGNINTGSSTITTTGAADLGATTVDSLSVSDGNITNVGTIDVDTIRADADSQVTYNLNAGGHNWAGNTGDMFSFDGSADVGFEFDNINGTVFYMDGGDNDGGDGARGDGDGGDIDDGGDAGGDCDGGEDA